LTTLTIYFRPRGNVNYHEKWLGVSPSDIQPGRSLAPEGAQDAPTSPRTPFFMSPSPHMNYVEKQRFHINLWATRKMSPFLLMEKFAH